VEKDLKDWTVTEEVLEANRRFKDLTWTGALAPTIHLEDVSGIPFVSAVPGVEEYQHRARVRAFDNDLFASVSPVSLGYEAYCQELGLGRPTNLQAEPVSPATQVTRACLQPNTYAQLLAWARSADNVLIHPYMAIDPVWELARTLQSDGVNVSVVGAPPAVLWLANDKSVLSSLIEFTLGSDWIVQTEKSRDVERIADLLSEFATRHEAVGLKRTRCASAMGNAVFDAASIRAASPLERLDWVKEFLHRTEWCGTEDVLIVEWVKTDLSPSAQTWIPPEGHGPPRLDGIYEQLLEGTEKVFLGSHPSTLSDDLNRHLGDAALKIAVQLQRLGYVGRCSFDFVVTEDGQGKFTECNGRWGGTSTPMFLVDRLFNKRPHYIAQDWVEAGLIGASFPELKELLQPELYDPKTGQGRFILYNVGPLTGKGKFDIISLGDPQIAREGLAEVAPRLLARA